MEYVAFNDGEIIAYSRDKADLISRIRHWIEKNAGSNFHPRDVEIFQKIALDWQ